ncbi:hypothetical protein Ae168Ps1_2373 [Pseudonocardia sp. Ae168_Ps1]|uniref:hypothetical protein n=1 Tax=unclassified Pseudonocardia TaxID=2619320 RepID=UPI00094B4544|nr:MULTISPECIES: hypothetical protein [unclassified Pseudonocardia]OLL73990.1 hypothetical protein Ae150APs1_2368 [Pseudonocardia sp. Ae150A_Ps1]OLL79967.1 hypothetical protein Ae168Ps1_2373 [Pseudonocardia sp. Ae168_Ps1]OLL85899.1 hypothetical protein Ae263Ps1_2954c [Pseudonocardia sp. Ae263_Ps1]OLL94070.1 hypothetical protein Ae356Ps1_3967 [Pseudonocardia sp. Ae356_Ps1]
MDPTSLVVTVAVVGLVLYKQFSGRFVGGRDTVLPFVVVGIGLVTLATAHPAVTGPGTTLLAAEIVLAAGLGVVRGYAFRLEARDGYLFRSGSAALLGAWALTIAVRIGAELLGGPAGAGALIATTSALVFGASLAVQAVVLRRRAAASGVPIRPGRSRAAA